MSGKFAFPVALARRSGWDAYAWEHTRRGAVLRLWRGPRWVEVTASWDEVEDREVDLWARLSARAEDAWRARTAALLDDLQEPRPV